MDRLSLWPIPVADLGGVARHVLDVGGHGVPGWRLVVLCPAGPFADLARERGLDVRAGSFGRPVGAVESIRSLRATVAELHPDVVHTHLAYADLIAAVAGPGSGGHLVSTEHGIADDDGIHHASPTAARAMAVSHRLRLHRLDGLIAVSQATLRTVENKWHPPASLTVEVIPNGVDEPPGAERGAERQQGMHVGTVARLAPEKDLETLIDAFALVAESHPDARLTIAGDGPAREELVARADAAGIGNKVRFPGHVDARAAFAELDVVVLPSRFENCSYTLLEAMRSGCGVVASDVGGNPEILPADALARFGDVTGFADAIIRQGSDPTTRPRLVDGWPTVGEMCGRIADFYGRVCA